ncbi:uncharacterized protein LOC143575617 [Bidens hawaiensis]|uniref:uncharacterized protein LOC143575617 n=1 Tax=Bidens hawaiensis TaxID=980011 RepID=UPI00404B52D3
MEDRMPTGTPDEGTTPTMVGGREIMLRAFNRGRRRVNLGIQRWKGVRVRGKVAKYVEEYGHFLYMFKQLKINLLFVEALQHMSKYAKFLKDLLNKKKMEGLSTVCLNEGCSAVVQNKLSEKLADPGHVTIPCLFGSSTESYALADLGVSINLMPYSLYKKLDLGEPIPMRMSLSLADRSVKYPWGIVENILVKVDKFVFPVDFVILDMEADDQVPLILRRPFLRTAKALIDVFDGKITLRLGKTSPSMPSNR